MLLNEHKLKINVHTIFAIQADSGSLFKIPHIIIMNWMHDCKVCKWIFQLEFMLSKIGSISFFFSLQFVVLYIFVAIRYLKDIIINNK